MRLKDVSRFVGYWNIDFHKHDEVDGHISQIIHFALLAVVVIVEFMTMRAQLPPAAHFIEAFSISVMSSGFKSIYPAG